MLNKQIQFPCRVTHSIKWKECFPTSMYNKKQRTGTAIRRFLKAPSIVVVEWDNAKGWKSIHESFLLPLSLIKTK